MTKKTILISESNLINMIKTSLQEQISSSYEHTDEDYIDLFLEVFKTWLINEKGIRIQDFPTSYLLSQHMKEFSQAIGMPDQDIDYLFRYGHNVNFNTMKRIAQFLLKSGKKTLPSLRSQQKFTEKYKKLLDFFVKKEKLPDYAKIAFIEKIPYELDFQVIVNFEQMLKSPSGRLNSYNLFQSFKNYLADFGGIEFGNPLHGKLGITQLAPEYIGQEEWVKNVFEKQLKKKIKEIPGIKGKLKRMKLEIDPTRFKATIRFSFDYWNDRSVFMPKIRELLESEGYNTDILQVETY